MSPASPVMEVRVDPELKERAKEAAKAQGLSLSAWVKVQMQAGLHVHDGETPTVDKPVRNCKHPRDQRRILTFGSWCLVCAQRVR